jgi:enoyl-CoA hydratase/carnithine racemase
MPDEIEVVADGPLRIITLNRPDALNAVNDPLHTGLARLWPRLSEDYGARAAVLTGAGRAFSAGGDFGYLEELSRDPVLRAKTIAHGRDLVLGMARARVPVVAAVNGPAVGLGCSLVALSDVVYMAESAYLADPHVQIGLVAADGGPLTWPLHTSLLLAKEYALTGARIGAARAAQMGLANHVVADPLTDALACAKRVAGLPRQAVESTKRLLNLHLERAVLASLDFATTAEEQSFGTEDFRSILAVHSRSTPGALTRRLPSSLFARSSLIVPQSRHRRALWLAGGAYAIWDGRV